MKRTIVFFDGTLYGFLLEQSDYRRLGGVLLERAFRDHHVQLVLTPVGQYDIVDDMNSGHYEFVHDARINMLPCEEPRRGSPWELDTKQSGVVCEMLANNSAERSISCANNT